MQNRQFLTTITKLASLSSKSALCVVAPRAVWHAIQSQRWLSHKQYLRWPPHINLIWPFLEDEGDAFECAAEEVAETVKAVECLQVIAALHFVTSAALCTVQLSPLVL